MESTTERIKRAFERNGRAMSLRPAIAQGTAVTRVKLIEGMTCEVEDGAWKLTADLGEKSGGANRGPNPGVLGRAALGTCMAMGYVMWAAKMDVPIDSLEIEVQADYDARGYHGIGDVAPGYEAIRYIVTVASSASDDELMAMLDAADEHSDFLHVFSQPNAVEREVRRVPVPA